MKCSSAPKHSHCTTLQHAATRCNTRARTTLLHTASHYNICALTIAANGNKTLIPTLHHTAPHCNTLQHTCTYHSG